MKYLQEVINALTDPVMKSLCQKELDTLLSDKMELQALNAYGVDNWQGYSDAMQYLQELREQS